MKTIINSFAYLHKEAVVHIDLYTERPKRYKRDQFQGFITDNKIDETCIFLCFMHEGRITPLYKYSLYTYDGTAKMKAHTRTLDELVDLCYQICISIYKNMEGGNVPLEEIKVRV